MHTFDASKSSSDEPTESSFGMDSPPLQQRRSPPRRKPPAKAASAAAAKRGGVGAGISSRRSAAASGGHGAPGTSGGSAGLDTRAASAADLNHQLDELDATFTSLGIVGRQLGGDGSSVSSPSSLQSSQTSCQLQQQLDSQQQPLQQSSGSSGSRASRERRRTQPFSWEERSASQQDNWNYQKVRRPKVWPAGCRRITGQLCGTTAELTFIVIYPLIRLTQQQTAVNRKQHISSNDASPAMPSLL